MNTTKFLNNQPIHCEAFAKSIRAIRTALYSIGICWADDVQGQFAADVPFRVVLYTRKTNTDFKNPMAKECNGLVYVYMHDEKKAWKLLAMPQYAFCTSKISMKKLDDLYNVGNYDVFKVLDASILTLYHFKGEWGISSTKGYDIGNTEMVNDFTYMDAIRDLMQTKYKAFRFENLNKNYSYTIALRHHSYHIFDEAKHMINRVDRPSHLINSYVLVMCAADTKRCRYVSRSVHGLPYQAPMVFKSNDGDKTEESENSVSTLINYSRAAYAKYAKAHELQNFKYKPLYGYILRAKHGSVPSEYTTIYIESELYRAIKIGLYKDNTLLRSMNYDELVVQMAMNTDRYAQFKIMFQQFSNNFAKLDNTMDTVSQETVRLISCEEPVEEPDATDDVQKIMQDDIATPMISEMVQTFKGESNISSGIVKDAILSQKYVHVLRQIIA